MYINLYVYMYMKFVFLGRQTINGSRRLLFQQTCPFMRNCKAREYCIYVQAENKQTNHPVSANTPPLPPPPNLATMTISMYKELFLKYVQKWGLGSLTNVLEFFVNFINSSLLLIYLHIYQGKNPRIRSMLKLPLTWCFNPHQIARHIRHSTFSKTQFVDVL